MTNFDKVRSYYGVFDEENRLANSDSGKLEYEMTLSILNQYCPKRLPCISENRRVLKNGGLIFASYIPYLSGSIAILDRYC